MQSVASFIHQFPQYGDKVALQFFDQTVTYADLHLKVEKICLALQAMDFPADAQVGIYLENPIDAVICFLAALRCQVAFVPLDFSYPAERISYMIDAANVAYVILSAATAPAYNSAVPTLDFDTLLSQAATGNVLDKPRHNEAAIYTLFTSGSTGKPKGALLKQQGVENLLTWYVQKFDFKRDTVVLSCTSLGFDLTLKNIFAALMSGAKIVFCMPKNLDPAMLAQLINREKVTSINCTPSIFYAIVDACASILDLASLRYILLGGERIKPQRLRALTALYPKTKVINTYGPTECSDIACVYELSEDDLNADQEPPVGKAIQHVKLVILDDAMQPVPLGEKGRLFIGGISVGFGYINDPELTKRKFVTLDLAGYSGLFYDTGDLVCQLDSGHFKFIDRVDNQVKLRGLRIELGEIEKNILTCQAVTDVVVQASEMNGVTHLVAYVVPKNISVPEEQLRSSITKHLLRFLPEYMLPRFIKKLNEFPKNNNGKVDRNKLDDPSISIESASTVSASAQAVVGVFRDVLEDPSLDIDVNDSFFELGGYSLLSFRLLSELSTLYEVDLGVGDLIDHPTPALLAAHIEKIVTSDDDQSVVCDEGHFSVTQVRYFSSFFDTGENTLNLPLAFNLAGVFDIAAFKETILAIVNKHAMLSARLVCTAEKNYFEQVAVDNETLPMELYDLSSMAAAEQNAFIDFYINKQVSANLLKSQGVCWRINVFKLAEKAHLLLFNFHHTIFDGSSWNIFKKALGHGDDALSVAPYNDYLAYELKAKPAQSKLDALNVFLVENGAYDKRNAYVVHSQLNYRRYFTVPADMCQRIDAEIKNKPISPNGFFYAMLYAAFKETMEMIVNIGFVFTNRMNTKFDNTIGVFVRLLPCKVNFEDTDDMAAMITASDSYFKHLLANYANTTIEQADPAYTASVLYAFHNTDTQVFGLQDLAVTRYPIKTKLSVYQLEFHVWPADGSYVLELIYNPLIYPQATVERLFEVFLRRLEQFC